MSEIFVLEVHLYVVSFESLHLRRLYNFPFTLYITYIGDYVKLLEMIVEP